MIHDGCIGCEYETKSAKSKGCEGCRCTFKSKYSPKRKEHVGCEGCDYENASRDNENCKTCMHQAPDKYKPKKVPGLTERDAQGNWRVKGIPWEELFPGQTITQEMNDKLYGCLFKLMQYEYTGLTPYQVEQLMEDK